MRRVNMFKLGDMAYVSPLKLKDILFIAYSTNSMGELSFVV